MFKITEAQIAADAKATSSTTLCISITSKKNNDKEMIAIQFTQPYGPISDLKIEHAQFFIYSKKRRTSEKLDENNGH